MYRKAERKTCPVPGPQGEQGATGSTGPTGAAAGILRSFSGVMPGVGTGNFRYAADNGNIGGVSNVSTTPIGYPVGLSDVPVEGLDVNLRSGSTIPSGQSITFSLVTRSLNGGIEAIVDSVTFQSGESGVKRTSSSAILPGGDQASYDLRVETSFIDGEVNLLFSASLG